jgi:isopenicillin-N N-acyltransferase-like protein
MNRACKLIEIWGSPRERGLRHGEAAATEIREGVARYLAQMATAGLGGDAIAELAEAYRPTVADFDADYIDEMRGIAEGADVPFAHVMLLNARTELLKLAGNPALRAGLSAERHAEGCTTIIIQPERTAEGTLIHAHNWDWKATCADSCVILRIRVDDGPDMLTFTEAGGLARFGFNEVGITVTGNYLECERDYTQMGVPLALIRRKVLQQANPSEAFGAIYTTPKSGSNNLALSHGPTGIVHDLECAPNETFVVEPVDGLLVHTNHWISPVAQTKLRETGIADSPCSFWREQRARRLLAGNRAITTEDVRRVLADDAGSPLSICVPPRASSITGQTATVASLIMRPALGEMDIAMMPSESVRYDHYSLSAAPATERAPGAVDA